ncbi:MAG TPA: hypothetical protein VGO47_13465 [Chlamydiales bacterium]|nr:hypothetical protein [Chlamydiales bacterium]
MQKWLIILLFPFLIAGTNQGSILLYNDSTYILTATIQAADGTYLGQFTIQPGQQSTFSQSLSPTGYTHAGAPNVSLTPYTVIWQCSSEEFYSVCNNVGPGAMVRANDCYGVHACKPKPKEPAEGPASTLQKKK